MVNSAGTKTIATSIVSRKQDYSNTILYNITNRKINKLQSVQNCLARVVLNPFSTILQCHTFVKTPTLAPCSIQNKIQNIHQFISIICLNL